MAARRKFGIETEYINAVFASGIANLTVRARASESMRKLGADITDVNHVFMTGRVVLSDMLEMRGLWHVRGKTVDGLELELIVAVVSGIHDVDLLDVLDVKEVKEAKGKR